MWFIVYSISHVPYPVNPVPSRSFNFIAFKINISGWHFEQLRKKTLASLMPHKTHRYLTVGAIPSFCASFWSHDNCSRQWCKHHLTWHPLRSSLYETITGITAPEIASSTTDTCNLDFCHKYALPVGAHFRSISWFFWKTCKAPRKGIIIPT